MIDNMRCPECKWDVEFKIVAECWATLTKEGVTETTDFDWSLDAPCTCVGCKFHAKVRDFRTDLTKTQAGDVE